MTAEPITSVALSPAPGSRAPARVARPATLLLLSLSLLAGCGREQVVTYRVPKEKSPAPAAAAADTDPHNGPATMPQVKWGEVPEGWELRPPGNMRAARFGVRGPENQDADISIIPMAGINAPLSEIVNVWREQIGLPRVSDADLPQLIEKIPVGPAQGDLFDLAAASSAGDGKPKVRILVAMTAAGGVTWFFKMSGPESLTLAQRPAFLAFLKSVRFEAPADDHAGHDHAGHDHAASPATAAPATTATPRDASSPGRPQWELPAGWQEVPPTQLLLAKFVAKADDGQAEITVSSLAGDAGGLVANINRWRGQLGLAPASPADAEKATEKLDVAGTPATVVSLDGVSPRTGKSSRLITVIVARAGQTWFYKLTGDPAVADREKAAFLRFVQTVRYPGA